MPGNGHRPGEGEGTGPDKIYIPEAVEKNILHEKIMNDTTKGEPITVKLIRTY